MYRHLILRGHVATLPFVITGLLALLSACGGGGSTSSDAGQPPPPPPSTVTVGMPPAGTPGAGVVAQINAWRSTCGFAPVAWAQNLQLSALDHAEWVGRVLAANVPNSLSVAESGLGLTNPLAADVKGRELIRGYPAVAAEETLFAVNIGLTFAPLLYNEVYGATAARVLMSNPAQMATLFRPWEHIGSGEGLALPIGGATDTYPIIVVDTGSLRPAPDVPAGTVATFPCDGVTNVIPDAQEHRGYHDELNAHPLGAPIYIRVRAGSTLGVVSASVSAGGAPIALVPDGAAQLGSNEAVLTASSPLAEDTVYSVALALNVDGAAVTKNFQFTTGKTWDTQLSVGTFGP